ncbi:conserved protein of unknown function [Oenococcus oeni]|uniref:Uncharacterized protein n=1 Tax=Oenococcus oeni TaxID=1247 RepID=A0AAQ2ZF66_OENOE|nr:conserved hypothetical protein [Oenococcus oeni]SYW06938.1 conserved hypothetical protein [Oenococcus oeni]SYW13811.1 conserved hypothetical protein [Oenococcus oeni]VDB99227.1 conserved protein of unknown function [Oenococcus oeni]
MALSIRAPLFTLQVCLTIVKLSFLKIRIQKTKAENVFQFKNPTEISGIKDI